MQICAMRKVVIFIARDNPLSDLEVAVKFWDDIITWEDILVHNIPQ